MRIAGAYLRDFEPFADQAVTFAQKASPDLADVHFFVGQNGTGKTRLLSLLAAACGNPTELNARTNKFASTVIAVRTAPHKKSADSILWSYETRVGGLNQSMLPLDKMFERLSTERIESSAAAANLNEPRAAFAMAFRSIPSLEDQRITPMGEVKWPVANDFLTFAHHAGESNLICQSLANLKVRMGIVSADPTDRTVRMVNAFDKTIQAITGHKLIVSVGYVGKEFRLKVSWAGREMRFNQLPDGLRAICGWLASCVCKLDVLHPDVENPLEQPLILLLDEPDAYLHPAWQRQLIPAIQRLLPNAQIFVSTHSPFVVSSVNEGSIYVFAADADGKVTIGPPQPCGKGDSYIDVVEDVLGIREQFDPETEGLLTHFRAERDALRRSPSPEAFERVRSLAKSIATRGQTLEFMMGREMAQLEKQLPERAA